MDNEDAECVGGTDQLAVENMAVVDGMSEIELGPVVAPVR